MKTINPRKKYWASFNYVEFQMIGQAVIDCSHSGQCDEDVAYWQTRIVRPASCTKEKLAMELKGYGAWNSEELADDEANWRRIIWIGASNISDSN